MKPLRAGTVLLTCAAMAMSSALHAQARAPVKKAPPIEKQQIKPCTVSTVSCLVGARERAVALTWAKGLDEQGMPLDASARARKSDEMKSWLRRLAGRYRIEGTYTNLGGSSQVLGSAQCLAVGEGPGVSCAITAAWKAPTASVNLPQMDKALYDAMQPLVIHYGIDPDTSRIRATVMDHSATKMQGFLIDDGVAMRWGSLGGSANIVQYSWGSTLVTIKPDGDVNMKFGVAPSSTPYHVAALKRQISRPSTNLEIEFDMQLHREPQVDTR